MTFSFGITSLVVVFHVLQRGCNASAVEAHNRNLKQGGHYMLRALGLHDNSSDNHHVTEKLNHLAQIYRDYVVPLQQIYKLHDLGHNIITGIDST